ncbi:MAG: hypothetical protein L0H93_21335, partial [Nocardioides sp.]|nr:hypothetical protein [Nocardioides sp.]
LAHAAVGFIEGSADRRWRAGWRVSMFLALIAAFTPSAWLFAVVVVVLVIGALLVIAPRTVRVAAVWGPLVVSVAVPLLLLAPGVVGMLGRGAAGLFQEAGRAMANPGPFDLLAGRFPDLAAPEWVGLALVLPALVALLRGRTRTAVVSCWVLVALAAAVAAVLSRVTIDLPAGVSQPGLGFSLVLIQGALIVAVMIAAHGMREVVGGGSFTWRQPVAAVLAALIVVVPLGGLAWWLVDGDNLFEDPDNSGVPAYMTQAVQDDPSNGVLIVRGNVGDGLTWTVRRGDGITLGQDEILALTDIDDSLDKHVTELVSQADEKTVMDLAAQGIEYVVLPSPADAQVAATLDSTSGVTQASTADRSTRAWELDAQVDAAAIDGDGPWWHPWLLALQVVAVIVVAVLCGPSRREER